MLDFFDIKVALVKAGKTVRMFTVHLVNDFDSYDDEREFVNNELYYAVGDEIEERDAECDFGDYDEYKILDIDGEHDEYYYRRPTLADYGMSERDFL